MTEDIRLYSIDFKLLCIAHRVCSSSWEIYYNKIGTFEAHISIDKYIAPVVFDNRYLIATEGKKQAFVTAKQINTEIVLYGKTLNYLLSKRTVLPFNTNNMGIANNPVTVCNRLVNDVFIIDREVETGNGMITVPGVKNMHITDNSADFEESEKRFYRTEEHPLLEVLTDRLDNDSAGHRLIFDIKNKCWLFEVYKGSEIPLLLSKGNRNMYEADYTEDIQNYFCGGFYERTSKDETDTENEKEYIFTATDEYYNLPPICAWDTSLTGTGEGEALGNLQTKVLTQEIQGIIDKLKFGVDYNLGDMLRVQIINDGFKRTLKRRVRGIKIYREQNELSQEPILE